MRAKNLCCSMTPSRGRSVAFPKVKVPAGKAKVKCRLALELMPCSYGTIRASARECGLCPQAQRPAPQSLAEAASANVFGKVIPWKCIKFDIFSPWPGRSTSRGRRRIAAFRSRRSPGRSRHWRRNSGANSSIGNGVSRISRNSASRCCRWCSNVSIAPRRRSLCQTRSRAAACRPSNLRCLRRSILRSCCRSWASCRKISRAWN